MRSVKLAASVMLLAAGAAYSAGAQTTAPSAAQVALARSMLAAAQANKSQVLSQLDAQRSAVISPVDKGGASLQSWYAETMSSVRKSSLGTAVLKRSTPAWKVLDADTLTRGANPAAAPATATPASPPPPISRSGHPAMTRRDRQRAGPYALGAVVGGAVAVGGVALAETETHASADPALALRAEPAAAPAAAPEVVEQQAKTLGALADNAAARDAVNGNVPQDPAELVRVAETIRLASRPVILLCAGQPWYTQYSQPYSGWAEGELPALQAVGRATGLVLLFQINPDKSLTFDAVLGTAVAVGPRTVVTNRHVLESGIGYKDTATGAWKLTSNRVAKISFPYEYSGCNPTASPRQEAKVIGFKGVGQGDYGSGQADYVALQVDLPLPHFVTFRANDVQEGEKLAVIGYPTRPEEKDTFLTTKQIDQIFEAPDTHVPFPALRAAYGLRLTNPTAAPGTFSHDASTWFGSSGSAIVNLRTGAVVGLQQGGMSARQEGIAYNIAIDGSSVASLIAANP